MKSRIVMLAVAALLVAGTFAIAQAPTQPPKAPPPDPRIDKVIEQNELILKNQDEIMKSLADMKESLLILKRRSS
jgi:hypothetical protein